MPITLVSSELCGSNGRLRAPARLDLLCLEPFTGAAVTGFGAAVVGAFPRPLLRTKLLLFSPPTAAGIASTVSLDVKDGVKLFGPLSTTWTLVSSAFTVSFGTS